MVKKKKGDCYMVAARFVLENPEFLLVHADVRGQGKLKGRMIGHAWNEYSGIVVDNSNGRHIVAPKDAYYAIAKPENIRRYTNVEAARHMLKSKHYGDWE